MFRETSTSTQDKKTISNEQIDHMIADIEEKAASNTTGGGETHHFRIFLYLSKITPTDKAHELINALNKYKKYLSNITVSIDIDEEKTSEELIYIANVINQIKQSYAGTDRYYALSLQNYQKNPGDSRMVDFIRAIQNPDINHLSLEGNSRWDTKILTHTVAVMRSMQSAENQSSLEESVKSKLKDSIQALTGFEKIFPEILSKKSQLQFLTIKNYCLNIIEPNSLNHFIGSILLDSSLRQLNLSGNHLHTLDPNILANISTIASQNKNLAQAVFFSKEEIMKDEANIKEWPKERQQVLLESCMRIQDKYRFGEAYPIIAPKLSDNEVCAAVRIFTSKPSGYHRESILNTLVQNYPCLKTIQVDINIHQLIARIESKTDLHFLEINISDFATSPTIADLLIETINHNKQNFNFPLKNITISLIFKDHTEIECNYLAEFIRKIELPKKYIRFYHNNNKKIQTYFSQLANFMSALKNSNIDGINLSYLQLNTVDENNLEFFIQSLLSDFPLLTNLDLNGNHLHTLNPSILTNISTLASQNKSLTQVTLFSKLQINEDKTAISEWPKERQQALLESCMRVQDKVPSFEDYPIIAPKLSVNEVCAAVRIFTLKQSSNREPMLSTLVQNYPFLGSIQVDINIHQLIAKIESKTNLHSLEIDISDFASNPNMSALLIETINHNKQNLPHITIKITFKGQTETECDYLAKFIHQVEVPKKSIAPRCDDNRKMDSTRFSQVAKFIFALKGSNIDSIDLNSFNLQTIDENNLMALIKSLLSDFFINSLRLCYNRLHLLSSESLKTIATLAASNKNLTHFNLFERSEIEKDIEIINTWPKERQQTLLKICVQIQHKNYNFYPIVGNKLDQETISNAVSAYIEKPHQNKKYILTNWIEKHPFLKKFQSDIEIESILLDLQNTVNVIAPSGGYQASYSINLSNITSDNKVAHLLIDKIKESNECFRTLQLNIDLTGKTPAECCYLINLINQMELPKEDRVERHQSMPANNTLILTGNIETMVSCLKTIQNPRIHELQLNGIQSTAQPSPVAELNNFTVQILSKVKQLRGISMNGCSLVAMEETALEAFIKALLLEPNLTSLSLARNNLHLVNTSVLTRLSQLAATKENLKTCILFDQTEIEKDEDKITVYSAADQQAFLETCMRLQGKTGFSEPYPIIATQLTEEIITNAVALSFENPTLHAIENLKAWFRQYPFLEKLASDASISQTIGNFKNTTDPYMESTQPHHYGGITTNLEMDLSQINSNSHIGILLITEIKNRKKHIGRCTITITLNEQMPLNVYYLINLINQIELPLDKQNQYTILCLKDEKIAEFGTQRLSQFILGIKNPAIVGFQLQDNSLGTQTIAELTPLFDALGQTKNLASLDLSHTQMEVLGHNGIASLLPMLYQDKEPPIIILDTKILTTPGIDFLKIRDGLMPSAEKKCLFQFSSDDNNQALIQIADNAEKEKRWQLIKLQFLGVYLPSLLSTFNPESTRLIPLSPEEYPRVFQEICPLTYMTHHSSLSQLLEKSNLDPVNRAACIKQIVQAQEYANSNFFTEMKFSEISAEDKLDIFLAACEIDTEAFHFTKEYVTKKYEVCEGNLPGNRILSPLKDIILADDDWDADQDIIAGRFRDATPDLNITFKENLPPAFSSCIDICFGAMSKDDPESIFSVLQRGLWFTWACAKTTMIPALIPIIEQEKSFGDVIKQILDFANPSMRYTLTSIFFEKVCSDKNVGLYFSITKDSPVNAFIPSILLTQIALQEPNDVTRTNLAIRIKNILPLCAKSEFEGRFYRTMVSGLLAIAKEPNLSPTQKIELVEKILSKSPEHQRLEIVLRRFFELCKDTRKQEEKAIDFSNIIQEIKDLNLKDELFEKLNLDNISNPNSSERTKKTLRTLQKNLLENIVPIHYRKDEFKKIISYFIMVQGLANIGQLPQMVAISKEDFDSNSRKILQDLFELTAQQLSFYDETFALCPNEAALLTYYSKIRTLTGEEGNKVMGAFKRFIQTVLSSNSQDFYDFRYDTTLNSQLAEMFQGRPHLEKHWKQDVELDLPQFLRSHNITPREYIPDFVDFIENKLFRNQHFGPKVNLDQYYGLLREYLDQPSYAIEAKEVIYQQAKALVSTKNEVEQKNIHMALGLKETHATIQLELLNLLKAPIDTQKTKAQRYDEHLQGLGKIKKLFYAHNLYDTQFRRDIETLTKALRSNKRPSTEMNLAGYKIVRTTHYWRVFLCGTDVEGSCQSVDGQPSLNKCLMGYVVNGYMAMVAILDPKGKTFARAIIKLLPDEKTKEPTLFLEKTYPDSLRPHLRDAIIQFTTLEAEKLNVSLATIETFPLNTTNNNDEQPPVSLVCKGGHYPVYEDGNFRAQGEPYNLNDCTILYKPKLNLEERANDVIGTLNEAQAAETTEIGPNSNPLLQYCYSQYTKLGDDAEARLATALEAMHPI